MQFQGSERKRERKDVSKGGKNRDRSFQEMEDEKEDDRNSLLFTVGKKDSRGCQGRKGLAVRHIRQTVKFARYKICMLLVSL